MRKALSLIIEINFFNVFFNFESKYETYFTLTLIVFVLEGENEFIRDPVYLYLCLYDCISVKRIISGYNVFLLFQNKIFFTFIDM